MCSTETVFGVTQPGDPDYPLKAGEGAAGSISEIRKRCSSSTLYEDPDFPANAESIGATEGDKAAAKEVAGAGDAKPPPEIVWLRPHEICTKLGIGEANFALADDGKNEGASREVCSGFDIRQGKLGDCWYLAALGTVTMNPAQLAVIVPLDDQLGFEAGSYVGAFHFRFFNMGVGKFVDVVVDDRLPCNAEDGNPRFAKVTRDDEDKTSEFWPALMEKAFAKFQGGYDRIEGGVPATALEFFTGGFAGCWMLDDYKEPEKFQELVGKLRLAFAMKTYVSAGTKPKGMAKKAGCSEGFLDTGLGLRYGHAYSVLGGLEVKEIDDPEMVHLLLRLKNPWGHAEWKGPLSDGDDAGWARMEQDLRGRDHLGSANVDEGVFWMALHDVVRYFCTLEYCVNGLDGGAHYCTTSSEWSPCLQERKTSLGDKSALSHAPAFSFEVRKELHAIPLPPEHAGKCGLAVRIAPKGGETLNPMPRFMYHIFEIRAEQGDDPSSEEGRAKIYESREPAWKGGPNDWWFMNELGIYLLPGRYLIVVSLETEGAGAPEVKFEAIPFRLSIFTENETNRQEIN